MKKSKFKLTLFMLHVFVVMSTLWLSTAKASNTEIIIGSGSEVTLQQPTEITGKVIAANDEPVPGVNIVVKGTTNGVITDLDGNYSINVPAKESVLVFSFVGYLTEAITVGDQTTIDLILIEDIAEINAVVVTAFGIKREEKSLGYAVSSIKAEDITLTGSTDFASALYGKAAGVRVNAANGGAASAVNIQIRGVTSVNNNTQPLYVVDGIPIRNHAMLNYENASNDASFWDEQRVRENGILDINPEDIESLTILKGASASALYGSEAGAGVVVITTKKGTAGKKGLGVDINFHYDFERIAFQPDYQNTYGPGYDRASNLAITGTEEGWITEEDGAIHPYYGAYGQFGPKFDGREVTYWDGSLVSYSANKDNYKEFFDKGYNATTNVAFTNGSEVGSYRFSYTRTDYKGIMPGFKMDKNNFNFNGVLKLNEKVSIDLVSSYVHNYTHNRPYMMNQLFASFSGYFSRMDDMSVYRDKSGTSKGYKWVANDQNYDDDEKLLYRVRASNLLNYYWTQLNDDYDENHNRFINSATLNIAFTEKLSFRGRLGNDFSSVKAERKEHNQYPVAFNTSGYYDLQTGQNSLFYGDALLSYSEELMSDLDIRFSLGYTGKKDVYSDTRSGTNGGLVIENWFSLSNSANSFTTNQIKSSTRRQAYQAGFGILDLAFRDYLFLQGTARYEETSTLPPGANSYFYPSVNGSFVFSDVFTLPYFISHGKLRGSWGMVGNHPEMYQASVAYGIGTVYASQGSLVYLYPPSNEYGNDEIKSEKKVESEIGLEFALFNNKLGLDISYYNNVINDQIMWLETASSAGSTSMLNNVGKLQNQGLELAINTNLINTRVFRWDMRFNYAYNKNTLLELMDGVDYLTMYNLDGGSVMIRAEKGEALGNIYVHPIATDENGNKIVNEYGLYNIDYENYEKVGSVMPKAVGGFANTFSFGDFRLDIVIDYKLGGSIVSPGMHYMTGAGMFENTMEYRDAEHGGLTYTVDESGNSILDANGEYHDGIILEGVDIDGNENTTIVSAPDYYLSTFGWGSGAGYFNQYKNAVNKNSYIKLREVAFGYNLPANVSSKIGFENIKVSLVGRNLAYLWKTLPNNWDPESATGSSWLYQGIDQAAAAPTRSLGFAVRASF
jgi:iron complex outermembrane receptor protein